MANVLNSNPVYLDTFTSAIDLGNSLFSKTLHRFCIESIEWTAPTTVAHTAIIKDGSGKVIFNGKCSTAHAEVSKYFDGKWVDGITVDVSGVASGVILIELK